MSNRKRAHRVIALLTRDQIDFLDQVGKDALFSTGRKLSRTKIISAMVELLRSLGIDGRGIHDIKDLKAKIYEKVGWEVGISNSGMDILMGKKEGKDQRKKQVRST